MRAEKPRHLIDASAVRVPGRAPRWIVPTVKVLLVLGDAVAAAVSFIGAFRIRQSVSAFGNNGWLWSDQFAPYGALLIIVVIIRLLTMRYVQLYRIRGEFSFVDDALRVLKATAIGSLLIVAAAFLTLRNASARAAASPLPRRTAVRDRSGAPVRECCRQSPPDRPPCAWPAPCRG